LNKFAILIPNGICPQTAQKIGRSAWPCDWQCYQMVFLHTKDANFGKFGRPRAGKFWYTYLMAICYINCHCTYAHLVFLWPLYIVGIFCDRFGCCTKKNLTIPVIGCGRKCDIIEINLSTRIK
jgi:hypothetical protein